ncbi:MAG: hypothetical protein JWR88_1423 [Pseudonocardia sp.]|nr:hypothetical protein [Pseudonocardia sp.]
MSRIDESDHPMSAAEPTPMPPDAPERSDERAESRADSAAARLGADTMTEPRGAGSEPLIPADRSAEYRSRWDSVKGQFVDDPRSAVQSANTMVGEILDDLEELFRRQRSELEQGLSDESTSTEDLRLALRRYRSFFDRLLSF